MGSAALQQVLNRVRRSVNGRWLFGFAFVAILLSSEAHRYLARISPPDLDFYDYYLTAQMVHDDPHVDIYQGAMDPGPQPRSAPETSELFRRARLQGFSDVELYLYPPLLADVLAPVSSLPPSLAASLWRLFNIACVVLSALLTAKLMRLRWLSLGFAALLTMFFCFGPVRDTITAGQATILMMTLWAGSIAAFASGLLALSAILLAVGTMLKVTPLLAVPLFLLWRQWRWLSVYCATCAALLVGMAVVNGMPNLVHCFQVLHQLNAGSGLMQNKSLAAILLWIRYGRIPFLGGAGPLPDTPGTGLLLATRAASAGLLALTLFLAWRRRNAIDTRPLVLAVYAVVVLCVSPVSWRCGYCLALVPLGLLWKEALTRQTSHLRLGLLTAATIVIGALPLDDLTHVPLPQPILIAAASCWVLVCLGLCLEVLWNGPEPEQFAPLPAG